MPHRSKLLWSIAALWIGCAGASAQTETGAISGSVLDATGSPIADARVEAESLSTGAKRNAMSSGSGVFSVPALGVGHYRLRIAASGFQSWETPDLELQVGQNRTVDAQLQLATVSSQVNVVESAPALDQTSAAVGGVVSGTQVRELPLNGRNWASLMTQTPGAVDAGTNNQRSIRFAGRGLDDNNFRFDGVDATGILNQAQKGTFRLQFSTEAIAEFRANAGLYTAESGGTEGGQVDLVSRSGSNAYHGSAFEYLRNDFFDARGPIGAGIPELRLNQFGGSVGGVIRKNKDFFFASYEGFRQRVGQNLVGFVPSAQVRQTLAGGPLAFVLNGYPLGTSRTSNAQVDLWSGSGRQVTDEDFGLFRYDHHFSDSVNLFVRYNADGGRSDVPNGSLLDRTATTLATHNAVIGLTTILSPRSLNEFKVGFNRADFVTANESQLNLQIAASPYSTLYNDTGKLQASNSFDWLDAYSINLGRHAVKAGFEIRRVQINATATLGNDYELTFTNVDTLLANRLSQASLVDNLPTTGFRRTEYFGFVQDQIRVTPNLTANLGVRYEYFGVPHDVAGRGTVFDPLTCPGGYCPAGTSFYKGDFNNFSPRISLAWAPSQFGGKTVVRTGYGIYYGDGQVGDLTAPLDNLAGRVLLTKSNVPSIPFLSYPLDPFQANAQQSFAPRALDRNRVTPYVQDWGLSIQQALTSNTVLTVGYLGTKGTHQFTRTYLNAFNPAIQARPLPQFSLIDYKTTSSNASFNGLQTSLQRNLSTNLIANVNYLWSHAINDGATGGGETTYPQNVNCRACERASSDYDIRHYFSGSLIYQLPFGKGKTFLSGGGLLARIVGGWEWSNIFSARSGLPVNVTISRTANQIPDQNTSSPQRPNVVPGQSVVPVNQNVNNFINSNAFATPAAGTFGNAGRNLARGPDTWQLDTALSKRVAITERLNLAFRCDAFNIFNRSQYGVPGALYAPGSPSFGRITTTVNPTGIGTGTPRELQLSLRIEF